MRIQFIVVLCSFIFFSGCALNQDMKSLERRVSRMEVDMQQIKDDMATQQAKNNHFKDQYAGQGAEFDQMREAIAKLNGRLDETEHNFDEALKKNAPAIAPMTPAGNSGEVAAQQQLPGGVQLGVNAPNQAEMPAAPAQNTLNGAVAGNLPEKDLYNVAKESYDREDYNSARQGFGIFLKSYPKSDLANNARFWIGESYFKQGWFQKAILEYQDVIEKYPNGNKVPSAYLKQGLSFDKLGEKANARLVFQELIKKFPKSSEAKTARQKISQLE